MDTRLVAGLVIVVIVIGAVYVVLSSGTTPDTGDIQLSNLLVTPSEAVEGDDVVISVNATNTGSASQTTSLSLKINNAEEQTKQVTLDAGESEIISWIITKAQGTYSVNVGSLTSSFSIVSGITLTIITRHDTTIWTLFEPAFLASDYATEHNVVDLKWLSPDAGLFRETIGATDIDIAWGGGPTLFDTLLDLFSPLDPESYAMEMANAINNTIAGGAMKRFDDQDGVLWVAAAISSFGFTVNEDFLDDAQLPTPNKWEDLANETYGQLLPIPTISMGNAPGTTSNTRIYEIIIQAFGWNESWRILTRMAGNAGIYGGSVETQSAVEQGEVGIAMSIDFYGYTSQLDFPNTQYILPEGQTIINGDPIALIDKSQHQDAAQAFIGYVLSPEGQSIWLDQRINRMPVRSEAFLTPSGQQRSDLYEIYNLTIRNIGIPFSDDVAVSYEESLKYYFEAVLKNEHESLVTAWTELVDAKHDQRITQQQYENYILQLGTPVSWYNSTDDQTYSFTQAYAQSINARIFSDSLFRNQMQGIWGQAAREQYQAIYDDLTS